MKTEELYAIADVSITVIGQGLSISPYVARCLTVFQRAGLRTNIHALGTNVEGSVSAILDCIKECHSLLHTDGVARIVTNLTLTSRTDRPQSIQEKIHSVTSKVSL